MRYFRNTENNEVNSLEELELFFSNELTDEDRNGRTFNEWLECTDPRYNGTLERLQRPEVLERRYIIYRK